MTSKTATIDGIEMRWQEHGTGTPVVLVHGIPTSAGRPTGAPVGTGASERHRHPGG